MTDKEKAILMAHTGVNMFENESNIAYSEYIDSISEDPSTEYSARVEDKATEDFYIMCSDVLARAQATTNEFFKSYIINTYSGFDIAANLH